MQSVPRPPVFQDTPFARAMERSAADGLWLVVSVTAQTDSACRAMDEVTWRRAEVCEWIERKALAVQIDIDTDREVARALNVLAVPTTIVFRAGKHEDRVAAFQDAAEISAWLSTLERRQAKPDGHLRDSSAKMALDDQRYDEATKGYVWLWNNIPGFDGAYETGWMGVRQSFMIKDLESLVRSHPPAHAAFSALRDASGTAAPAFDLTDWFGPRIDWLVLNRVLAQEDRTLEWFNSVKADPRYAPVIEHCAILLLAPLKEGQHWADIGRLFANPLATLAELREFFSVEENFREEVVVLYAGLRAAGRRADAKAVREEAVRLDPSDKMRRALEQAPGPSN